MCASLEVGKFVSLSLSLWYTLLEMLRFGMKVLLIQLFLPRWIIRADSLLKPKIKNGQLMQFPSALLMNSSSGAVITPLHCFRI